MMILKKTITLFLTVLLCAGLSACGSRRVEYKNPDGTVTKIVYRSAVPFERAPYFERSGGTVCMTFNGTTWYEASIIDRTAKEQVSEGESICESSNIRVYKADAQSGYGYAYVLTLSGTEDSYILFRTDESPMQGSYGNDFETSIRYFVDRTETVPDLMYD